MADQIDVLKAANGRLRDEVEILKSGADRVKLLDENRSLRRRIDEVEGDMERMRECVRTLILLSGIRAADLE